MIEMNLRHLLMRAVLWWKRKTARRLGEGVYYINGADTLPPPLNSAEEAEAIRRAAEGDSEARDLPVSYTHLLCAAAGPRHSHPPVW